ncbi:serine/arginine-rich splicing factor 3a isoform X2 [Perca fluviatilis]|uniref:serine/arginine-rich splicing factor 3a isoform X2 n=1 Tax=Perca fluviatilis TaxID=8168 RepID=UPI0019651E07|nr:serine/arginine-rich splicing factor 3a isoform X2 [Perca fluviatilis]
MQFPASSSSSSNLNPIDSGPLHIINQSASLLYSSHNYCINGNSPWLTSLPILPPPKKAGKIYNYPFQPATKQLHISNICIMWQILSAIRLPSPSVWLPCVISILSKSPKIEEEPQSQQVSFKRQRQTTFSFQRQEVPKIHLAVKESFPV